MADKDTLNLIKFKFGSFQSIKDLSSKDQSSFYFASDKPAFYNAGLWYGVSSLTSSVNEETGEVTLVINGDFGDNWESSQVKHTFVAGMTTQQKADLEKAVSFVNTFEDPNIDNTKDVIDKWNEIVDFLAGFKDTDVLLDRIVLLETNVTKLQNHLQNTSIIAGDGLRGGGDLSGNLTIGLGEPSTITDSTINEAKGTTHTHAIDEASTEQRGIVRLNDTLTSDKTDQALTAKQGKVLKEHIDETVEHIDEMFELIDKGNGVKEIKAKYGLWSDSFISARGVDNESSGVGGLDAQAVWDLLMQNDDATKIINVAHIPDITISKITDIANASVANAKTLDGVALNRFPYIYGYKGSLDLNTYVDGENKFYSLFIGAGHSSIPSGATYSTLLNVAGYNADTSFQLIGCQFQDKLYYRGGSSSPDGNNYIFNKDWKQIAFRETTLAGYGITDAVTTDTEQTITGVKTFRQAIIRAQSPLPLTLDNTDPNYTEIGVKFTLGGVNKAWVGYTEDTGVYFYTYNAAHRLGLKADGTAYVDNNTIYHAGNLSPVTTNTDQTITGNKSFSIFYGQRSVNFKNNDGSINLDMTTSGGASGGLSISVNGELETSFGAFYGYPALVYSYISFKDEDSASNPSFRFYKGGKLTHKTLDVQESAHANMIANLNAEMVGGVKVENLARQKVGIDINNGDRNYLGYGYASNGWYSGGGPAICAGIQDYYMMLFGYPNALYYKYEGTGYPDQTWKTVAFTDSNVASATKLKTPRNIWGHSFDGTADVWGDLSYVKTIHAYNNAGLRISANSLDYSPTSVGELAGGLLISSDSAYGLSIWNDGSGKAYLQVGRTDGINTAYSLILQHLGGNVGIGTTSPTAKLHVNGDSIINGKLTVANQLTIGNATLYWDVANQCLRVNTGLASDSFLSAKGIDTTGNGQGGGGGFDATMLWNELTIPSPTNSGKTIMLDLLPDMPTSKVTDFANQVKALITVENIPILTSAKISDFNSAVATAMASTLADISSEFTSVNNRITTANTNINSLEERIVAIEQALTWQGI